MVAMAAMIIDKICCIHIIHSCADRTPFHRLQTSGPNSNFLLVYRPGLDPVLRVFLQSRIHIFCLLFEAVNSI